MPFSPGNRIRLLSLTAVLLLLLIFAGLPPVTFAAAIAINSTGDTSPAGDGACTLREAMNNANSNNDTSGGDCAAGSGADTISFNLGAGPNVIVLGSRLPTISEALSIDGTGQNVEIDASSISGAPFYAANMSGLMLKNLAISSAQPAAVQLYQADDVILDGLQLSPSASGPRTAAVYATDSIDILTMQNISAAGWPTGIYVRGGSDVSVLNSVITGNSTGLQLQDISAGGLPGGLNISGSDLAHNTTGLRLINLDGLVINGSAAAGNSITLDASAGLETISGNVLKLNGVTNTIIDNVDFSAPAGPYLGNGITAENNSNNLTVQNSTINNRGTAVSVTGASGLQLLDNDLSSNVNALILSQVQVAGLNASGNNFAGSINGLTLISMSGLTISDGTAAGTHVTLDVSSGLDTVSGDVLNLLNVNDALIKGVDLSYDAASSASGIGVETENYSTNNLTVENVTVANRQTGLKIWQGSNLNINCSVLLDNNSGIQTAITNGSIVDNHLEANGTALANFSGATLVAENNYWGAADGPSNLGGSGDSYSGSVDADPFLTELPRCAGQIQNNPPLLSGYDETVTVAEGRAARNLFTAADPDGDRVTLTPSVGVIVGRGGDQYEWIFPTSDGPEESQTVSIAADDGFGGTAQFSFQLVVENVAPQIAYSYTTSVYEGFTFRASLNNTVDPGDDTIEEIIVDWGDGTSDRYTELGAITHSYDDGPASPVITVSVVDEDGTYPNPAPTPVMVNNLAPAATFNYVGSTNLYEGEALILTLQNPRDISAADTAAGFEYSFDCGDGAGYTPYSSSPTYTCPQPQVGAINVYARIRDKDGDASVYTGDVIVTNVPPQITGTFLACYLPDCDSFPLDEGESVEVYGELSDPGLGSGLFSGTLTWGTGAGEIVPLTIDEDAATFSATVVITDDNPSGTATDDYFFTIDIDDGAGGAVSDSTWSAVPVYNRDPEILGVSVAPEPSHSGSTAVVSATFSDAGLLDTHICTVNYGDGSDDQAGSVNGDTCTGPAHTYERAGLYEVEVTIIDDDTGRAATTTVHRVVAPPTAGELTERLIDDIDELVNRDLIDGDQTHVLYAMLEQVLKQLERGDDRLAIRHLENFMTRITNWEGIHINEEIASQLRAAVEEIIALIVNG